MDEFESDQAEFDYWKTALETATGWSSAYFAAKQLEAICRKLGCSNPYPITVG